MYSINVNGKFQFNIEKNKEKLQLKDEIIEWDIIKNESGIFNIIWKNKVYNAEFIKADPLEKSFIIRVNGNNYDVKVKDKYDILLKELGLENLNSIKVNQIKAPMPGLVLKILLKNGDLIKKGDSVLILEAMKMENILKSPGDGKIKAIKVKQGQAVEKNQVLIELE